MKEVLNIKQLRLNIFSTILSTKERDCWKEKTWRLMPVFLLCPVILLKRTICWEFVEKISLWLSYQYILFSTIHQKYIHHLIHSKTWTFKKQSKSRLQTICKVWDTALSSSRVQTFGTSHRWETKARHLLRWTPRWTVGSTSEWARAATSSPCVIPLRIRQLAISLGQVGEASTPCAPDRLFFPSASLRAEFWDIGG